MILQRDLEHFLSELGVVDWGYTEENLSQTFSHFEKWVENKHHEPLSYMADYRFEMRRDLKFFFPLFESALVFLFPYFEEKKKWNDFYRGKKGNGLKMAGFALGFDGEDYHDVLKEKLKLIGEELKKYIPDLVVKATVDVHPILERDLAYRAGLGWFGKNSMLISKEHGSYFMIGALLLSQKVTSLGNGRHKRDKRESDHCGNCTRCIDLCPTQAIDFKLRTINASKCISTFTIEVFKDSTQPPQGIEYSSGEIFGCDICQEVCPWNDMKMRDLKGLIWETPKKGVLKNLFMTFLMAPIEEIKLFLNSLSNRRFRKKFKTTALARTGRVGLLKNLKALKNGKTTL